MPRRLSSRMDIIFYRLLRFYGVPDRIISTLQGNFQLPKPYAANEEPKEISGTLPWLYFWGATGTGKSTYAAYLLAVFLRCRSRLGDGKQAHALTNEHDTSYLPTYRPRGSAIGASPFYRYVRVSDLLYKMKADFGSSDHGGAQLFQSCVDASFLILDDLTTQPSNWELTQLDLLIDQRYGSGKQTIITSNHPLERLGEVVSERIRGRIGEIARQKRMTKGYR